MPRTIRRSDYFGPFEYRTSPLFRSPLYWIPLNICATDGWKWTEPLACLSPFSVICWIRYLLISPSCSESMFVFMFEHVLVFPSENFALFELPALLWGTYLLILNYIYLKFIWGFNQTLSIYRIYDCEAHKYPEEVFKFKQTSSTIMQKIWIILWIPLSHFEYRLY